MCDLGPAIRCTTVALCLLAALSPSGADGRQAAPTPPPGSPPVAGPSGAPLPPPQPPATTEPAAPADTAEVTAARNGWIAVRSAAPLRAGDRFELRTQETAAVTDPITGAERTETITQSRGVVALESADGGTGRARLPRGVQARPGDLLVRTQAPLVEHLTAPPRSGDLTRVEATVRPVLAIGNLGGGAVSSLSVSHHFGAPLRIGVELAPLGFLVMRTRTADYYAGQSGGTGIVGEGRAFAAFSSDYFEVGLGAGVDFAKNGRSHLSIAPMVRLGSLDGLRLVVTNAYKFVDEGDDPRFKFGSMNVDIAIPLTRSLTLDLQGGGSERHAYGTIGLNTWLRGNGGPGTLILHTGVGGAHVTDDGTHCDFGPSTLTCTGTDASGGGPTVSIGIDSRF